MPQLRNRSGTPVDAVPAIVVSATAFLVMFSWGPIYLLALGLPLEPALAILVSGFVLLVSVTYHQMIWTAKPGRCADLPTASRVARLRYAIGIGFALIVLFSLPFLR